VRHSDGGISKPVTSFLQPGFLNPRSPVAMCPIKVASGMVPLPSAPTVISGLVPGGPRAFDSRAEGTANPVQL
jgi:hypothetical protein